MKPLPHTLSKVDIIRNIEDWKVATVKLNFPMFMWAYTNQALPVNLLNHPI